MSNEIIDKYNNLIEGLKNINKQQELINNFSKVMNKVLLVEGHDDNISWDLEEYTQELVIYFKDIQNLIKGVEE